MFLIIEEAKETILDFSQGTMKVLYIYFTLIWYQYKMTQYNTLNVKLFNSQLNKIKFGKKIKVTLKISSDVVGNSNDENKFPHKLLLTKTQVSKLRRAFGKN